MELSVEKVSKQYQDKMAVKEVSVTFTPGIWGLLGANGAGKTTLMRMMAGIIQPTSGKIAYDGIEIGTLKGEYRKIFGYLPQEFGFYPEFRVKDYLVYMAALKGLQKKQADQKITELLERLSLQEVRKKKIIKLSGGMKRRVGIAQALLNEPKVLLLDEPTSGLDPGERVRFRKLISEVSKDSIVLISTHIVSDIEFIANQNAIMKEGEIIEKDTTEHLVQLVSGKVWECQIDVNELEKWEQRFTIVNMKNESNHMVQLRYLSDEPQIEGSVLAVPRLEDLYLWLFPQEKSEN